MPGLHSIGGCIAVGSAVGSSIAQKASGVLRRQNITVTCLRPLNISRTICTRRAIVRQHTNKFQIVAYHMALIAGNTLQYGGCAKRLSWRFEVFLEPSIDVYLDSFASALECSDQTYYDPIMSVHRP
jgi:hypothetical protein